MPVSELSPGRSLDCRIAEALGWGWWRWRALRSGKISQRWLMPPGYSDGPRLARQSGVREPVPAEEMELHEAMEPSQQGGVPAFSTDAASAITALEDFCRSRELILQLRWSEQDGWLCLMRPDHTFHYHYAGQARSCALAICKTILSYEGDADRLQAAKCDEAATLAAADGS